jgi:hypothetical protein
VGFTNALLACLLLLLLRLTHTSSRPLLHCCCCRWSPVAGAGQPAEQCSQVHTRRGRSGGGGLGGHSTPCWGRHRAVTASRRCSGSGKASRARGSGGGSGRGSGGGSGCGGGCRWLPTPAPDCARHGHRHQPGKRSEAVPVLPAGAREHEQALWRHRCASCGCSSWPRGLEGLLRSFACIDNCIYIFQPTSASPHPLPPHCLLPLQGWGWRFRGGWRS